MIERFVERFEMLSRQPLIGEPRPENIPDLRSFPVRPYMIYYRVAMDEVTIFRILHGAQDFRRHF